MKKTVLALILAVLPLPFLRAAGDAWSVSGIVTDASGSNPLPGAVVNLEDLWSVTDADGRFFVSGVKSGRYDLKVKLLGYADYSLSITVSRDIDNFRIKLKENTLALKEVVVTSSRPKDGTGTTHEIGRDALNHLQLSSVSDMASLLPGGKTTNPDLTQSSAFLVRDAGSTAGNLAFSTALEVDGVRMGNNASFGDMGGVDTRSVSVDNIESIEVISGVPSAEYGDLGAGMVKIHTRHGRSPYNISFTVNPRTWQASASKGYGIGDGALNVSAEWAKATKKLVSPYESYTRRGITFNYSNTFARVLRFEAGLSGNLGGMNTEDDPDAFKGAYTDAKANTLRANTMLNWLVNRPGITNLKFEASVNFSDNFSLEHAYNSSADRKPAVHSTVEFYSYADLLPSGVYFSDKIIDSKELDFAASLKYGWNSRPGDCKSKLKAGLQWKAEGNAGKGEYYGNPALAADGFRPRDYSQYPFMHNLSAYAEEDFTLPFGLQLTAGIRMDNVFVRGSDYKNVMSFSPRFNARWNLSKNLSVRAGWGVSEKLPSFNVLFPIQEYRDILVDSGTEEGQPYYKYYTFPYRTSYNPELKWQRSENAEAAVEGKVLGTSFSLVGFYNVTRNPYKFENAYRAVHLKRMVKGIEVNDDTFVSSRKPSNGAPIYRYGAELTLDFPKIKPIRTSFRLDASYSHSRTEDRSLNYYYNANETHTILSNHSYQYVGIYSNGGGSSLWICGKTTDNLNANLTSITHIPEARLVITCKLEMSLLTRSCNIPTNGRTKVYPVAYMTTDGVIHEFTEEDRTKSEFSALVKDVSNDYTFNVDGYGAYASANLSVTKEIGKHVSLSFFANNFTNSRPAVTSIATGVSSIFTPTFYYGLTCRIKL